MSAIGAFVEQLIFSAFHDHPVEVGDRIRFHDPLAANGHRVLSKPLNASRPVTKLTLSSAIFNSPFSRAESPDNRHSELSIPISNFKLSSKLLPDGTKGKQNLTAERAPLPNSYRASLSDRK
jgi:hypothetical protein